MRSVAAAALVLLLAAACSTTGPSPNELNLPAGPSPEFPPPLQPANDPRVGELQTAMTELLERLDVMNDRLAKLEAAQADMMSSSERRAADRSTERTVESPRVVAAAPTPVPASAGASAPPRTTSPPARADIYNQYRNALVLYGKNRLGDARALFQQVFDAEPSGELADNALYWIGETYYTAGDFTNAMRFYTRVTKDFPNENKAPDAMFKIGLTYARTGDLGMARKALEETIRKYPYATAAGTAKAELGRIRY